VSDQLAALRAEVEALRDRCLGAEGRWTAAGLPSAGRAPTSTAYQTVLDLIDKHAREGQ
jgi:hypothetical protein